MEISSFKAYKSMEYIKCISFLRFFLSKKKGIFVSIAAGTIFGIAISLVMPNKGSLYIENYRAISFSEWRGHQQGLPYLASRMLDANLINEDQKALYRNLSSPRWFAKHIYPVFLATKSDLRNFTTTKELELISDSIIGLKIEVQASSVQRIKDDLNYIQFFFKEGSAYLAASSLIEQYKLRIDRGAIDLRDKILQSNIDLHYMHESVKNLKNLQTQFPENVTPLGRQVQALTDSNSKFMPISTQLVALSTDISNVNQVIRRLEDQIAKNNVYEEFISKINSDSIGGMNGFDWIDGMLKTEGEMRDKAAGNQNTIAALNEINGDLTKIKLKYTVGLSNGVVQVDTRTTDGVIFIIGTGFIGLLSWMLWCLFIWRRANLIF
jgi:hypothetical protein